MLPSRFARVFGKLLAIVLPVLSFSAITLAATYIRVNQAGYETGNGPFRAYLMSTADESAAKFTVLNSAGQTVYSGTAGAQLGIWSHSATFAYNVYPLDFSVAGGDTYTIDVNTISSPPFAVDAPEVLQDLFDSALHLGSLADIAMEEKSTPALCSDFLQRLITGRLVPIHNSYVCPILGK